MNEKPESRISPTVWVIAGIVMLVLIGLLYLGVSAVAEPPLPSHGFRTIGDALASGRALACTPPEGEEGNVYIKDGRLFARAFDGASDLTVVLTPTITHVWSGTGEDILSVPTAESTDVRNQFLALPLYGYDCNDAVVNDAVFTPPFVG